MKKQSLNEEAKKYFVFFLLGGGKEARRLSAEICERLGTVPYILSAKRGALDMLSPHCHALPLATEFGEPLCFELIARARELGRVLPILVPTTSEHAETVETHRELLEPHFVIRSPEELFDGFPWARFTKKTKGGKTI